MFANSLQTRCVNAVGYSTREFTNTKYVSGLPFVNTQGQPLKLKDIVLMDGEDYAGGGMLSWYDMDKRGFKFLDWSLEVYADPDDEDPTGVTAQWAAASYSASNWHTVSAVPEPTSGLLLLLGVAGLALKRKRA